MKTRSATLAGSVIGAALASACCLGPLVLALLGISGAAAARSLEPLRPAFLVLSYGLLGGGFYLTYRRGPERCGPGEGCERPAAGKAGRVSLWIAAVVVVALTAFPWYSAYLF